MRWMCAVLRSSDDPCPGACGTTLEGAALVLGEATPDPGVLPGVQCPLQAGVDDLAATAHSTCLFDLHQRGTGVPDREEQLGILVPADCAVAPVHGSSS